MNNSNFIEIDGSYVNVDSIFRVCRIGNNKAKVFYKNGVTEETSDSCLDDIEGVDKIVQVIPVTVPTVAAFKDDKGKVYYSNIHYLGLTAAGDIRPLDTTGNGYEFIDDATNFVRIEESR